MFLKNLTRFLVNFLKQKHLFLTKIFNFHFLHNGRKYILFVATIDVTHYVVLANQHPVPFTCDISVGTSTSHLTGRFPDYRCKVRRLQPRHRIRFASITVVVFDLCVKAVHLIHHVSTLSFKTGKDVLAKTGISRMDDLSGGRHLVCPALRYRLNGAVPKKQLDAVFCCFCLCITSSC